MSMFRISIILILWFTKTQSGPLHTLGKKIVRETPASQVPIKWWHRDDRYVERLALEPNSPM